MRKICLLLVIGVLALAAHISAGWTLGEAGKRSIFIGGMMHPTTTFDLDAEDGDPGLHFRIRSASLLIMGDASPSVNFFIHPNFDPGTVRLFECWLNWKATDFLSVRVGQDKAPFGRLYAASANRLMFMNRSPLVALLPGYQLGISPSVEILEDMLGVSFGAFNGEGLNSLSNSANADDNLLFTARAILEPFGTIPMDESANNGYDRLKIGIVPGISMNSVAAFDTLEIPVGDSTAITYGCHLAARYDYLALDAAACAGNWELEKNDGAYLGYSVQVGYALMGRFEPCIRYSVVDMNTDADDDETTTIEAGLNYYIDGYNSRIGVDYINSKSGDDTIENTLNMFYEIIF